MAVSLRRGSTTTTVPPLSRMASIRPLKSGAVHSEPLEAWGLAPSMTSRSVRSRSGTGTATEPNMRDAEISLGRWSTVLAENRLPVPSEVITARLYIIGAREWAPGLPR